MSDPEQQLRDLWARAMASSATDAEAEQCMRIWLKRVRAAILKGDPAPPYPEDARDERAEDEDEPSMAEIFRGAAEVAEFVGRLGRRPSAKPRRR
jgi:hypothetical protein